MCHRTFQERFTAWRCPSTAHRDPEHSNVIPIGTLDSDSKGLVYIYLTVAKSFGRTSARLGFDPVGWDFTCNNFADRLSNKTA